MGKIIKDNSLIFSGCFNFVRTDTPNAIIPLIGHKPILQSDIFPAVHKNSGKSPNGFYKLRMTHERSVIHDDILVEIRMAITEGHNEPFLVFISNNKGFFQSLVPYQGGEMELAFASFAQDVPVASPKDSDGFGFFGFNLSFLDAQEGNVVPLVNELPIDTAMLAGSRIGKHPDMEGFHRLTVVCEGDLICDMEVNVALITSPHHPLPFLSFQGEDKDLALGLNQCQGKRTDLRFMPCDNRFRKNSRKKRHKDKKA